MERRLSGRYGVTTFVFYYNYSALSVEAKSRWTTRHSLARIPMKVNCCGWDIHAWCNPCCVSSFASYRGFRTRTETCKGWHGLRGPSPYNEACHYKVTFMSDITWPHVYAVGHQCKRSQLQYTDQQMILMMTDVFLLTTKVCHTSLYGSHIMWPLRMSSVVAYLTNCSSESDVA